MCRHVEHVMCCFGSNIFKSCSPLWKRFIFAKEIFQIRRNFYIVQRRLEFIIIQELVRFLGCESILGCAFNLNYLNNSHVYRSQYLLVVRSFIMMWQHKGSYIYCLICYFAYMNYLRLVAQTRSILLANKMIFTVKRQGPNHVTNYAYFEVHRTLTISTLHR